MSDTVGRNNFIFNLNKNNNWTQNIELNYPLTDCTQAYLLSSNPGFIISTNICQYGYLLNIYDVGATQPLAGLMHVGDKIATPVIKNSIQRIEIQLVFPLNPIETDSFQGILQIF